MFDLTKFIHKERAELPSPNREIRITESAVNYLVEENIQLPEITNSLLLLPIGLQRSERLEKLNSHGNREIVDLVNRYINWRDKFQLYSDEKKVEDYSFHLRYLLREAYLEIPDFSFVILTVMYHHGLIAMLDVDQIPESLAEKTEKIFIPLVTALDLWEIRAAWIDKCAAVLHSEEYQVFEEALDSTEVRKYDQMNELVDQKKAARENRWLSDHREAIEKWSTFKEIEKKLSVQASFHGMKEITISWVEQKPGQALHSMREGLSKEELINRIGIHVFCSSEAECYQILGLVHNLGKPVAPKFSERFDDYIASPQVNGYQALHTAVTYKSKIYAGNGNYYNKHQIVEFRIVTKDMYFRNRWGIIAFRDPKHRQGSKAWWNGEGLNTITELIRESESNPTLEKIFVFTPQGKVLIMNEGDTALDFAYKIHTTIGNKATKILVNSNAQHFSYPLKNGDLVQVFYNLNSTGPEPSWLNYANQFSSKKIRKELRTRGESTHPGRAAIDHILISEIELFKKKGFELHFSSRDVDTFLVQVAKSQDLSDIFMLYKFVENNKLSPTKIVQQLIDSALVDYVIDDQGKEYQLNPLLISFCSNCRPVPGEKIIAYERIRGNQKKTVIHRKNNPLCNGSLKSGRQKHFSWKERKDSDEAQATIEIWAEDRPELVKDILDIFYLDNKVDFHAMNAEAHRDRTAEILISAFSSSPENMNQVCTEIESLPSVTQVAVFPKESYGKRLTTLQDRSIAFSEKVVFDRLDFFNREDEKKEVLDWINDNTRSNWFIIHGKRRVGKTSMCKHIENVELKKNPTINPVFIDMLGLSKYEPIDIAKYMVRLIFEKINLEVPIDEEDDHPFLWLEKNLEIACKKLKKEKIVVFIDEFDKLIELHQDNRVSNTVFNNFRYVMSKFDEIKWILVVQDFYFQYKSSDIFQLADNTVEIKHLNESHTKDLIEKTYRRLGITIEPSQTAQITKYSDGNPYITKLICKTILNRLKSTEHSKVTDDDFLHAKNHLLSRGMHHFAHFNNKLTEQNKEILSVIVNQIKIEETKKTEILISEINRAMPHLNKVEISDALSSMDSLGVIRNNNGETNIPLCLFHDWAIKHYKYSNLIT